jgi:hypothetical protein
MSHGAAAMENSRRFLKNLKIALPYDPAIPLLVICPKALQSGSQGDIYIFMCTAAFIHHNSQEVEATQVSTNEMWYIYIYAHILFSL